MLKKTILTTIIITMLIFQSCTLVKVSGSGPVPVYLNIGHKKVRKVVHVDKKQFRVFDYTRSFDASEVLQKEYRKKYGKENIEMFDAITNVRIKVKSSLATWAVNTITLGLARCTTIEVDADIVWYED